MSGCVVHLTYLIVTWPYTRHVIICNRRPGVSGPCRSVIGDYSRSRQPGSVTRRAQPPPLRAASRARRPARDPSRLASSPCPGSTTSGAQCSSSSAGVRLAWSAPRPSSSRPWSAVPPPTPTQLDRHASRRRPAPHRRRRRRHRPGAPRRREHRADRPRHRRPWLDSDLQDGEQVVVRYARPLTVTVDGVTHTYWTTELTVDAALARSASAPTAPGCRPPARSRWAGRASPSTSRRRRPSRIAADGRTRTVTSTAPTVGDLLAEQGITVGGDDQLSAEAVGAGPSGMSSPSPGSAPALDDHPSRWRSGPTKRVELGPLRRADARSSRPAGRAAGRRSTTSWPTARSSASTRRPRR